MLSALINFVSSRVIGGTNNCNAVSNDELDDRDDAEYLIRSLEIVSKPAVKNEETVARSIANLLQDIDGIRAEGIEAEPESQLNNIEEEEDVCIYAYGTITVLNNAYVLIDGRYMCEWKYIKPRNLKEGDKVHYMGYKAGKGEEFKVRKIMEKITIGWEQEGQMEDDNSGGGWNQNDCYLTDKDKLDIALYPQPKVKRAMNQRKHIGKIESRSGRLIYLEDKTLIDLDKVESDFVPCVGDYVELECLYEVNDEIANYKGELMEIKSIKPLRHWNLVGEVTEYREDQMCGKINNLIIFSKLICLEGYMPCKGDKVAVQCIQSDQELMIRWRALNVVPMSDVPKNYEMKNLKFDSQLDTGKMKTLLQDKNDIEISTDTCVSLYINEEKLIGIKIKNKGKVSQIIEKCVFDTQRRISQLKLIQPEIDHSPILEPEAEILYVFQCKPKLFGHSKEVVVFKFDGFKIGRIFEITVHSIDSSYTSQTEHTYTGKQNLQSVIPKPYEDGMYIKGVKPYKSARFIRVRPVTWKIPPLLWSIIDVIIQEKKTRSESELLLQEKISCLNQPVKFNNYKQRFNYLLYLEEIALILNMKNFNIDSAVMHRKGEYLTLNVPGLAEKRPSLIIGDRISICFQWEKESKRYEGYIHKIRSTDVYLKFNEGFHQSYIGEECKVEFIASTTVLQRCHTAISEVINSLGEEFLFPKKVEEKEPQYNFIDEDEEIKEETQPKIKDVLELPNEEDRIRLIKSIISKKRLTWFNKRLNKYQKEAVKNVLKGLARPLPYVIFGPPGTGKTVTVVEAILQIRTTISESNILIATPSNSSANLIAERLLDSKILQPGDLVRLVAYHYLEGDLIPDRLLPYCATADIAEEGTRSNHNQIDSRGCQTQVTLRTLCHYRIIIGTCSALGILFNMGCKPGHFTHILVDEAGQASEPEIMIPLNLAHKKSTQVVLAGDPKQLGPINQSRLAGYFGLNDSFLVRLLNQFPYQKDPEGFVSGYDPRLITKLLINYRSLPELLALPSKLFYDNELISQIDPKDSDEAQLLELLADELPKRLGSPPSIVFHCVRGINKQDTDSPSWFNLEEAARISMYLGILYNNGLKPSDVGIITPYSKQVHQINTQLALLDLDAPKVGSVEEFQGQERNVILLSTVRTSEGKVEDDVKHSLGFVSARERLNVAITRARALLIIIGHPELLKRDIYWRNVLEYCNSLNSIITDNF